MKHSIFLDSKKAENCRQQIQSILNANRGGYSGPPWIYVCVFPIWTGSFALLMPDKVFEKGIEKESEMNVLLPTLVVVDTLPFQPVVPEHILEPIGK